MIKLEYSAAEKKAFALAFLISQETGRTVHVARYRPYDNKIVGGKPAKYLYAHRFNEEPIENVWDFEVIGRAIVDATPVEATAGKPLRMVVVNIQRAEGETATANFNKLEFTGPDAEAKGNRYLRQISETAPKDGCYDKTDVDIVFENGQTWSARYDVKHFTCPDNDTNLRQHIRDFLFYHINPHLIPWVIARPTKERDELIKSMNSHRTAEEKAEWQALLNQIEGKV